MKHISYHKVICLGDERMQCLQEKGKPHCDKCKPQNYEWVSCIEWTKYLGFFGRLSRKLCGQEVVPKERGS